MKKLINIILFIGALNIACSGAPSEAVKADSSTKEHPNILLFIADDMAYHDVDNEQINTPNLDRLASQGIFFENVFNSSPMCAPTRMSLYSGIHPVRNGAHPNHSRVYSDIQTWPHYLNDLGYRTALIGKQHEAPKENFPFEFLGGRHHDNGKGVDLDIGKVKSFMEENKSSPWSLIVASNQPHRPWNRGKSYTYDKNKIILPPYLIDTQETRKALVRYYAEISYMDQQVGQVLQYLKESGQASNTIVVFLSEQGSNFPHSKWTLYDTGVRSAGIVRWPDIVPKGSSSSAIIQYVDILPTLLEAIGEDPSGYDFDGKSFLPVLNDQQNNHNTYAYSMQTSKGIYNGPDAYGIRSVRSDRYRLIWNLNWQNEFSNIVTNGFVPYTSWKQKADSGDSYASKRVSWYKSRPEFELYDLQVDPFELHNLAEDSAYQTIRDTLTKKIEDWMIQQGDKGVETEHNALQRQSDRWMN